MPNGIYNSSSLMSKKEQANFVNTSCRLAYSSRQFGNYMGPQAAVTMNDDATNVSVFADYLIH